jgi:hypothetical protein
VGLGKGELNPAEILAQAKPLMEMEQAALQELNSLVKSGVSHDPFTLAYDDLSAESGFFQLKPTHKLAQVQVKARDIIQQQTLAAQQEVATFAGAVPGEPKSVAMNLLMDDVDPEEFFDLPPPEQLAKLNANLQKVLSDQAQPAATQAAARSAAAEKADAAKAKQIQTQGIANFKKATLAGKKPSAKAQAAFNALTPDEQQDLLDALAFQESAPTSPIAPARLKAQAKGELLFSDFERIGPQRGSNPGGLFRHRLTGESWYLKTPASEDIARNELLAGKLYKLAGIEVPELRLLNVEGRASVVSKIVPDVTPNPALLKAGKASGVYDGFGVDAWLSNWDVVGLNYDNLLVRGDKAFRIDVGGSLRYRAQRGLKGQGWGRTVSELDTLRNPSTNPQSASVFGQITQTQLEASVQRVLTLSDGDIRRVVEAYGPTDAATRDELIDTLLARKRDLARRFPHLVHDVTPAAPPADALARVTAQELKTIREARINGYTLATDKGLIEDQQVLLWQERDAHGQGRTGAYLKVRGEAAAKLTAQAAKGTSAIGVEIAPLQSAMIEAMKGIGALARKGEVLRDKDLQRAQHIIDLYRKKVTELQGAIKKGVYAADVLDTLKAQVDPWLADLQAAIRPGAGAKATWTPHTTQFFQAITLPPPTAPKGAGPGLRFVKRTGTFEAKTVQGARATGTEQTVYSTGSVYETELDGVRVRHWADTEDTPFALRNRLEVHLRGDDADAGAKVFDTLEQLGVTAMRATPLDREELYLRQIAYHRRDDFAAFEAAVNGIADQEARVQAMRTHLSQALGVKDITKLPLYRPQGEYQAFGHGRLHTFRPDLQGNAWEEFQRDYVLHHENTNRTLLQTLETILDNGGQMAPTTDKLRRGLAPAGMSPEYDLGSGGAAYFFTRIQPLATGRSRQGLNWKSRLVGRLDAISYSSDQFGRVTEGHVLAHRKVGVTEWKQAARGGSNETIFKNSLSLFDDLDSIVVGSESERQQAIALFKKHTIDRWPDGRRLDEVIRVADQ